MYFRCPAYDGYDTVFVRGTGERGPTTFPRPVQTLRPLSSTVEKLVGGSTSFVGFGLPCRGRGFLIVVHLSDWRRVDGAVRRIGQWLAREKLGLEIVLIVAPGGPVPPVGGTQGESTVLPSSD